MYNIVKRVSQGAEGVVFKVEAVKDKLVYALKRFSIVYKSDLTTNKEVIFWIIFICTKTKCRSLSLKL